MKTNRNTHSVSHHLLDRGSSATHSNPRKNEDLIDGLGWQILEFLETVECPICPPTIAVNLKRSPTDTRICCQMLHSLGLIDMKDATRKAFELNPLGEDFLAGNVSEESLHSYD